MPHEPRARQAAGTARDLTVLPRLVPVATVAQVLGIHVNTTKRWLGDGTLPITVYRLGTRGDLRCDLNELLAWLEPAPKRAPQPRAEEPARRGLGPLTPAVRRAL